VQAQTNIESPTGKLSAYSPQSAKSFRFVENDKLDVGDVTEKAGLCFANDPG
jgi:hypothetical protein